MRFLAHGFKLVTLRWEVFVYAGLDQYTAVLGIWCRMSGVVPTVETSTDSSAQPNISALSIRETVVSAGSRTAPGTSTPVSTREAVVKYEMVRKEDSYTDVQSLRVFCGTWNVNGQSPTVTTPLADWLASCHQPPDIYAIGFQELDLSKEAFLFADTPKEDEWLSAVLNNLHPRAAYVRVRLVRLVGMMLIVLVQERYRAYVRNVAAEYVGTGIMGKMGNKGGVAVRMEVHSTSMCFVNSHLAAHVEEVERRNQDFHDICHRLRFQSLLQPKAIKDHDQIFWLGDLNYRVSDADVESVRRMLDKNQLDKVLELDQLMLQKSASRVFIGYTEAAITFRPTYKYDPGTDNWDSSEKMRAPAWCDRVLWRGEKISSVHYTSHPSLQLSDHKPVSLQLDAGVKIIDPVRYRRIYEDIMKELDKYENDSLPQVSVDTTEVIFGTVYFLQPQRRRVCVTNTGQVAVQFRFINKLNDSSYCKPWLSVEPSSSIIMPGEVCELVFELRVDERSAPKLNTCQDKLYDILVLHLENGKDIFITTQGDYMRSCFGASINALVHIKTPFSEVQVSHLLDLEGSNPQRLLPNPYVIPKELWFLVDRLHSSGAASETDGGDVEGGDELFLRSGRPTEVQQIRQALDTTLPDSLPGSVHSAAEALLLFLSSLPESVVPASFSVQCMENHEHFSTAKAVVLTLPVHHRNVFSYLCSFLRDLSKRHPPSNGGTDAFTLAKIFGAVLLRNPSSSWCQKNNVSLQALDRRKTAFVHHFLLNDINF